MSHNTPPIPFRPGQPHQPQPQYTSSFGMAYRNQVYYHQTPGQAHGQGYQPPQQTAHLPPTFSQALPTSSSTTLNNFNLGSRANYKTHLAKVQPILEREFKDSGYQAAIINNSEGTSLKYDFSIDIFLSFRLESKELQLQVVVPKDFPTGPPSIIVKNPIEHSLIDCMTKRLDYGGFYQWKDSSKVVELVKATEEFFKKNNPFKDEETIKIDSMFAKAEKNIINEWLAINWEEFYNRLGESDKQTVQRKDDLATIEIIKRSPEYQKIKGMKNSLSKALLALTTSVQEKHSTAMANYALMKDAQKSAEASMEDMSQTLTSAVVESQRFDKANVVQEIDNWMNSDKAAESKREHFQDIYATLENKDQLRSALDEYIRRKQNFKKMMIVKNKFNGTVMTGTA